MMLHRVEIVVVRIPSMLRLLANMSQPTMHLTRNLTTKALVYDISLPFESIPHTRDWFADYYLS